jgi:gamma-glutamyltranspeptidase
MGGQGQPQVHAQLLLRSMAGSSPQDAVTAPRWMVGASEPGDTDATVYVESDAAEAAAESLHLSGLKVKTLPPHSEALGHANLIRVDRDGQFEAASDPRADGSATVIELPA